MKQIEVSTYGIFPEDCRENTWKLRQMLDQLREEEGIQIIFEPGTYHFYPDYAVEKLLYISNHDEDTIKRISTSRDPGRRDTVFISHGCDSVLPSCM